MLDERNVTVVAKATAYVLITPVILALELGMMLVIAMWESWVAMTLWQWHVGLVPYGLSWWQLVWVSIVVSLIVRQFRPLSAEHKEKIIRTMFLEKFLSWGLVTPATALLLGWLFL